MASKSPNTGKLLKGVEAMKNLAATGFDCSIYAKTFRYALKMEGHSEKQIKKILGRLYPERRKI